MTIVMIRVSTVLGLGLDLGLGLVTWRLLYQSSHVIRCLLKYPTMIARQCHQSNHLPANLITNAHLLVVVGWEKKVVLMVWRNVTKKRRQTTLASATDCLVAIPSNIFIEGK